MWEASSGGAGTGTQFTCFTSSKVQILTLKALSGGGNTCCSKEHAGYIMVVAMLLVYMSVCVCVCVCVCVHAWQCMPLHIYIYIYIYVHTYYGGGLLLVCVEILRIPQYLEYRAVILDLPLDVCIFMHASSCMPLHSKEHTG